MYSYYDSYQHELGEDRSPSMSKTQHHSDETMLSDI